MYLTDIKLVHWYNQLTSNNTVITALKRSHNSTDPVMFVSNNHEHQIWSHQELSNDFSGLSNPSESFFQAHKHHYLLTNWTACWFLDAAYVQNRDYNHQFEII